MPMNRLMYGSVSALALIACAFEARAQDTTTTSPPGSSGNNQVNEVIVTGTRQTGVRAADSAAPVQVVGAQAFQHVGEPDLDQALQQNVPSFNVQQYANDTAALTVQAALRGLSPNDTLVLVNGKRRHDTANLSVDSGTPYSGAATVDLSLIPVGAIDHVEVLQDGAAAQYGSDAIAGVVNIILKSSDHGGSLSATGGQYYEGDGNTGAAYINKGWSLGGKGFVNATIETRYHDFSQQGGADRRLFSPNGSLLPSVAGTTNAGVLGFPGTPDVNRIVGDTEFNLYDGFVNAGYNVSDALQFYLNGSYAQRIANAFENYRVASRIEGTTSTGDTTIPFPTGFNPKEKFHEVDYSVTAGVKGDISDWHYDLSTTFGRDRNDIYTDDSANPSNYTALQALSATPITPQRNFYDGAFQFSEENTTLDITHNFNLGLASPLTLAFGGEIRHDVFSVVQGEFPSYEGEGASSFIGYTPFDAGTHGRVNYAGYVDLAADVIHGLHVDGAARYEHYSDFGDDEVGKITARYDFNPTIAIRGTVSSGFRAPTLQEEFYSGTNVGPNSAFIQLPADSAAAGQAGFQPLKPELSTGYSAGFVAHPLPRLQITADYYRIYLFDRILNSGSIIGLEGNYPEQTIVSQGVLNAITARGVTLNFPTLTYAGINIFSNAASTRTQGIEATASYASDFGEFGHVDWSVGFNWNDTDLLKLNALPGAVENAAAGQTAITTAAALSALLNGAPQEKAIVGAYWTWHQWSVNLREEIYGSVSELVSIDGTGNSTATGFDNLEVGATGITDLDIGYRITPQLRLNIGANNLFNQFPARVPNVNDAGAIRPTDGGNIYNVPTTFSPYGINGGYYYGRVTFNF